MRVVLLVAAVLISAACGPSTPASPSPIVTTRPAVTPAPPATRVPPPAGSFRTFVFSGELSYPVAEYTRTSQFRLYENGAFELSYFGHPMGYRGAYSESNGRLVFEWEGWSAAGPWGATGTLRGDRLIVEYNRVMQMTDFEDAVYALAR